MKSLKSRATIVAKVITAAFAAVIIMATVYMWWLIGCVVGILLPVLAAIYLACDKRNKKRIKREERRRELHRKPREWKRR